jgi:hypothetical protein
MTLNSVHRLDSVRNQACIWLVKLVAILLVILKLKA